MPRTRSSYRKRRVQSKHLSMDTEESRTARSLENVTSNVGKLPGISRQAQRGPKWNLSEDGGQVRCRKKRHRHQISKPVHKCVQSERVKEGGTLRIAAQARASSENWSLLWFFFNFYFKYGFKNIWHCFLFYYLCSPIFFLSFFFNFHLATYLRLSVSRRKEDTVLLFLMPCLTAGSCVCVLASCAAYFKPYTGAIDYKCHMNRIYNPEW